MAKAVGQTFPDFTPPDGETQDQVTSLSVPKCFRIFNYIFSTLS